MSDNRVFVSEETCPFNDSANCITGTNPVATKFCISTRSLSFICAFLSNVFQISWLMSGGVAISQFSENCIFAKNLVHVTLRCTVMLNLSTWPKSLKQLFPLLGPSFLANSNQCHHCYFLAEQGCSKVHILVRNIFQWHGAKASESEISSAATSTLTLSRYARSRTEGL